MQQADLGIEALRSEVDTLIVIPNDRLLSLSDRSVSVVEAFRAADTVLLQGVSGITDIITTPGLINLDFADVASVMKNAGGAFMGIGKARGENRAIVAAEAAIASPLLEASIDGARGVLLSIAGGSDLGLFEVNDAAKLVQNVVHPDANIIWGTVIDEKLGDEIRITVIAAGFDSGAPAYKPAPASTTAASILQTEPAPWVTADEEVEAEPVPASASDFVASDSVYTTPTQEIRTVIFDDTDSDDNFGDDGIDVPSFLK
jgi:cell division protein FtsZ